MNGQQVTELFTLAKPDAMPIQHQDLLGLRIVEISLGMRPLGQQRTQHNLFLDFVLAHELNHEDLIFCNVFDGDFRDASLVATDVNERFAIILLQMAESS